MIKSSFLIKELKDKESFKSPFNKFSSYLAIFLPFIFLEAIWSTKNLLFKDADWISDFTATTIKLTTPLSIFASSLKILNLFLPVIIVILWEYCFSNNFSLKKIKNSEGYKNADYWYFCLELLVRYVPFVTVIITFGFSPLGPRLSSWLIDQANSIGGYYNLQIEANPKDFWLILLHIIIYDFYKFLFHFNSHRIAFLWDYHEFHHSATEMTILNDRRVNYYETVFNSIILAPIIALSSILSNKYLEVSPFLPILSYGLYYSSSKYTAFISHSSTKIIYPKLISYILMSPSLHWIHHSNNSKHYDCNFGILFSFWDRLFGTYLGEEHLKDIECFGVEKSEYNKHHPLYSYLILPLVKTSRRIRKGTLFKFI